MDRFFYYYIMLMRSSYAYLIGVLINSVANNFFTGENLEIHQPAPKFIINHLQFLTCLLLIIQYNIFYNIIKQVYNL